MTGRSTRLVVALVLDLGLVGLEFAFAPVAHSTGLVSDAVHNLADALSLGVALGAVRLALRAPSRRHSFGLHRATILSALFNGAFLLGSFALIAAIAAQRLIHLHPVHGGVVSAVAGGATIVNGLAALALSEGSADLNMRGARLHLLGDAASSAVIFLVGLLEIALPTAYVLDPIGSLVVGAVIVYEGAAIAKSAIDILLESSPQDIDSVELQRVICSVPGVAQVHDLHVWSLSNEVRAASAHLLLAGRPDLDVARQIADCVRAALKEHFAIGHATLEVETDPCATDGEVVCTLETLPTHQAQH